ncbi:hypothetical protein TBLA_0H02130 [Henningerozyma blattae CBS 6284]|uniref:Squalene monooxygenase n=1 Tax=Henningerozyma blattae (strain ATCC 34711 / CBS 6284 / DSM 70876 / NBRC 10599 / NRRL Y-10934 / UCD 77-7) TaxID=1071380 RepID=I2H7Z7_HENB6|nr:hypothetical protein TBLA_0H02130 [Tetrapisispora blattae CBS 6284]CCH62499.1 hypothetical protein TBLA_0H02130 [Tetrapisispora blattae CBS 6284]
MDAKAFDVSTESTPKELLIADDSIVYDAIVVGAGVIGPCIATSLARKGKNVLIIEKSWAMPERIVGELMQPGGVRALRSLGMVQAINNIDAFPVTGYTVFYNDQKVDIPYPYKADIAPLEKIEGLVKDGNDQVLEDKNLHVKDYEEDERERGVAFVHGRFLDNLRKITMSETNVTCLQGNCIEILRNEKNEVIGTKVEIEGRGKISFKADLTFICDGIFSHFRKELSTTHIPKVESSFIGMALFHADIPAPMHGHVILGSDHLPIILYQISSVETRILCAYNSKKVPSNIKEWMIKNVQPFIPKSLRAAFDLALIDNKFKSLPNSYLPSVPNTVPGMCVIGDAMNMRHPLTGGGMTVGLSDVVLFVKMFGDMDFSDRSKITLEMEKFHQDKRSYDSVINTLSISLYSLFAAENDNLKALQKGCFKYFQRGGNCVNVPIKFLSGTLPNPLLLSKTFFAVVLYAIITNIQEHGVKGLPITLLQAISILLTACKVFTPYLYREWAN